VLQGIVCGTRYEVSVKKLTLWLVLIGFVRALNSSFFCWVMGLVVGMAFLSRHLVTL